MTVAAAPAKPAKAASTAVCICCCVASKAIAAVLYVVPRCNKERVNVPVSDALFSTTFCTSPPPATPCVCVDVVAVAKLNAAPFTVICCTS